MTTEQEQESRAEAERLKTLPLDDRKAFNAMLSSDGENRKIPKRDREFSLERADLLAKLLRLKT